MKKTVWLVALLAALGFACRETRQQDTGSAAREDVEEAAEETKEATGSAAEEVKEGAEEAAEETKEGAEDVKEKVD